MVRNKKFTYEDQLALEKNPGGPAVEGAEALKGDPFHYGKKKNWTGAKEGAYYASNVPTGHENILPGDVTTHKVFMVKKTTCKLKSRSSKRSKKIPYTGSFSDLVGKRYGR